MTTRRNVLTILGLAGVTSPAIATDSVVQQWPEHGPYRLTRVDPNRMAAALERLAAEIRNGTVNVAKFQVTSEIVNPDEWLKQSLIIDVEILHPEA